MNLLVTGGAGFIGSNFIRYMLGKYPDLKLVNLDKLTYAGNLGSLSGVEANPGYTFIKGDVCDLPLLRRVFEEHGIDVVVHMAAESHVDRSILGPEEFLRTNITGTFTLLEAARLAWGDNATTSGGANGPSSDGRVFINVSTDEVYGSLGAEGLFKEDSPYEPNSPYSASKAGADHLVRAYSSTYSLPAITTHCSNNYGPYQFPEKLIPVIILNALEGKPLPIYGDGLNVRDWIYVTDHCVALDAVLRKGTPGRVYNIGADCEKTNIELVELLCSALDELRPGKKPYSSLMEFVKDRPGHDRRYAIDSTRIKEELGWAPEHTKEHGFDKALKETVLWYLDNLEWCEKVRSGEYLEYYDKNYLGR